ncbi:MAG TPA: hypothetical protein VKK79_04260 [Candidatus Lokiarchaeia archaeon]|nr:hypothetical protein [Candidatus Lokiarchaeia archaeon]
METTSKPRERIFLHGSLIFFTIAAALLILLGFINQMGLTAFWWARYLGLMVGLVIMIIVSGFWMLRLFFKPEASPTVTVTDPDHHCRNFILQWIPHNPS